MSSKARHRTKTRTRVRDWDKTSNGYRSTQKARQSLVSPNETYIQTGSAKLFSTQTLWEPTRSVPLRRLATSEPAEYNPQKQARRNGILIPKLYATPLQQPMDRNRKSICEIRQERKEVMHATKKTGKTGQKQKTYTALSKIKCR